MPFSTKSLSAGRWALVGQSDAATAIAASWPEGKQLVQWAQFDSAAPWVDGIILAEPRLGAAYDAALTALARGIPVIPLFPNLLAVHGRILRAAAASTGATLHTTPALGLGPLSLPTLLSGATQLILTLESAADRYLNRLITMGDTPDRAEKLTRWQGDMADFEGKLTTTQAVLLLGQWTSWGNNHFLTPQGNPQLIRRVMPTAITTEVAQSVAAHGLTLRFGAALTPTQVYIGPLALESNTPLAPFGTLGLMAQHSYGWQSTLAAGTPIQRLTAATLQSLSNPRQSDQVTYQPTHMATTPLPSQTFAGLNLPTPNTTTKKAQKAA